LDCLIAANEIKTEENHFLQSSTEKIFLQTAKKTHQKFRMLKELDLIFLFN